MNHWRHRTTCTNTLRRDSREEKNIERIPNASGEGVEIGRGNESQIGVTRGSNYGMPTTPSKGYQWMRNEMKKGKKKVSNERDNDSKYIMTCVWRTFLTF